MTWPRNTGPANAARRGQPNHPKPANVARALADAATLLGRWQTMGYRPLGTSAKGFAAELGVSDRSVRRWLTGEQNPAPEHHPSILKWAAGIRRAAKRLFGE